MELNPDFRLKIFEIEIDSMEAETYIRKRDQLRAISRSANYPSPFRPVVALHLHNNNSRNAPKCNRNEWRRNITRLFPSPPPSAIINRRD